LAILAASTVSHILLHIGNSGNPTAEIGVIPSVPPEEHNLGKDSKTMYVNDSTNLDTIPFYVESIIDKVDDNDIE
jgi:hypothetical protein